eukprot:3114866-Amphidinium_carterae.1
MSNALLTIAIWCPSIHAISQAFQEWRDLLPDSARGRDNIHCSLSQLTSTQSEGVTDAVLFEALCCVPFHHRARLADAFERGEAGMGG